MRINSIKYSIFLGWPKAGQDLKFRFLEEHICCTNSYEEHIKATHKFEHEIVLSEIEFYTNSY